VCRDERAEEERHHLPGGHDVKEAMFKVETFPQKEVDLASYLAEEDADGWDVVSVSVDLANHYLVVLRRKPEKKK
jgi:hypothetical protein